MDIELIFQCTRAAANKEKNQKMLTARELMSPSTMQSKWAKLSTSCCSTKKRYIFNWRTIVNLPKHSKIVFSFFFLGGGVHGTGNLKEEDKVKLLKCRKVFCLLISDAFGQNSDRCRWFKSRLRLLRILIFVFKEAAAQGLLKIYMAKIKKSVFRSHLQRISCPPGFRSLTIPVTTDSSAARFLKAEADEDFWDHTSLERNVGLACLFLLRRIIARSVDLNVLIDKFTTWKMKKV